MLTIKKPDGVKIDEDSPQAYTALKATHELRPTVIQVRWSRNCPWNVNFIQQSRYALVYVLPARKKMRTIRRTLVALILQALE